MADGPLKRRILDGVLVVVSLTLTFAVLEIGFRLFWDGYYFRAPRENIQFHPKLGWANKPSIRLEYGKAEYRVIVEHNSMGLRSPEVPERKPPDKVRTLVLGDSMTYGLGVENDETYSARLEQFHPDLEVINGGVPAYSTGEELLFLQELGFDLSPDIVLIGFFWNDLGEAPRGRHARFSLENGTLTVHVPDAPPLGTRSSEPTQRRHPLLSRSYTYRFVSDRIKIARYILREKLGLWVREAGILDEDAAEAAWDLVLALLREIVRVSVEHGAKPLIAVIPDQVQVKPDVRIVGLDPILFTVQERLLEFGREAGVPVIDLLPGFQEIYAREGEPLYYRFDRHLTPAGHRAAAHLIGRELERLGLAGSRRE